MGTRVEPIGQARVATSGAHRFGTDAFLLSDFAAARRGEAACDLCSGCGIVALLWYREREEGPARLTCVELQEEAAALCEEGVRRSGLLDRAGVLRADLRGELPLPAGGYDLVTCNPPYKAAGTGRVSKSQAARLARHEPACTLPEVCRAAARLLRFGGRLCLSQRPERLPDAMEAMRASGIEPKRLRFVQKRPETPPWLFLLEGRRGGKPSLRVEPPLLVQAAGGGPSPEIRRIYRMGEGEEA